MGGKGFSAGEAAEFIQSLTWALVQELKFDLLRQIMLHG